MNDILYQRICKLIAMSFALSDKEVWELFQKTNSVDKILDMIKEGQLK